MLGQKQESAIWYLLLLTHDEALEGGTQAVFADTTSRPRKKFSGGHIDMGIGAKKFIEIIPEMMRQQTSFNKSIRMAGIPHHAPYADAPDFVAALPHIATELGAEAIGFAEVTPCCKPARSRLSILLVVCTLLMIACTSFLAWGINKV